MSWFVTRFVLKTLLKKFIVEYSKNALRSESVQQFGIFAALAEYIFLTLK